MSLRSRLFAAFYDRLTAHAERAGLARLRARLLAEARGDVLELGAGTGVNIPHYPEELRSLVLSEPDEAMARRLEARLRAEGRSASIVGARADALPVEDRSLDVVVSTLVLCTVPDPAAALAELRRVLRPDGRLLLLEHVRSASPRLAAWQDRLNPLQRFVALGCECNRDTVAAVEAAGFRFESLERIELPKAYPIVRPAIWAVAARS